jgi:polysaccharide biosynthesis transport protein
MFHDRRAIRSSTAVAEHESEAVASPSSSQFIQIDAQQIWSSLRAQKGLILATTAVCVLLAISFFLLSTRQYTATTQILIDPSDLRVVENGLTSTNQISDIAVLQVESQVRVLKSDNVLRRVIITQRLDGDAEFTADSSLVRWIIGWALQPFGMADLVRDADPTLVALYELQRRVGVKRAERTYVVDLSVTTKDAQKSMLLANAVAQAYLQEQTAARSEAARRASESLSARLSELKERVRVAEERVEQFKKQNSLVGANGQFVNEQQLTELNNQLSLARARTAEAKARFEQLKALQQSGADLGAFTEAVQSQTIMTLRAQYAEVMRREAEQATSLGARHPAVIELRAQIERLRGMIAEEVNRITQAARNEYLRAQTSEQSLTRTLEQLKHEAVVTNEAKVRLRELEREVQASRAVYEAFLVRSRETGEQERIDSKNVRIISRAELPLRRSWPPSFVLLVLGATFFGASAGAGIALLRETNSRPTHPARAPGLRKADLPVIAVLPDLSASDPGAPLVDPNGRAAVELRKLHDALRGGFRSWRGQSILLLGISEGVEAARLAINVAGIAAAKHRVLVVDADLRGRAAAALVHDQGEYGLLEVAAGRRSLSEAVVHDAKTNIHLLRLIGRKEESYAGTSDEAVRSAFAQTTSFDLVIVAGAFDGEENPLAAFFGELVNQIVLVASARDDTKPALEDVLAQLHGGATRTRGVVLIDAQ